MSKLCIICGENELKKGNASWCYSCAKAKERERWNNLPEWRRRAKWLKSKYRLNYEDYVSMYEEQEGKCKLCSTKISIEAKQNGRETACVDHCHTTNKIRGLLCNHCNRALGLLKEDIKVIKNMIKYLKDNT